MELNLPVRDQLMACENLLIAGMGGGFDVFCGLPIYFDLTARGKTVHLANYSFSKISTLERGGTVRLTDTLYGVRAHCNKKYRVYFPELFLSQWFENKHQQDVTIWCFEKTGARPLIKNYRALVEHLGIDGILVIDGGVDSLMRGDEMGVGTIVHDFLSLLAVNEMTDVPMRMLACLGLGAEDDIAYPQVFENIAALTEMGAFLGNCALLKQMPVYQTYEEAVLHVQAVENQPSSIINSSVISAVRGEFGDYHLTTKSYGSTLQITPLMSQYWFFDLPAVAERNLFIGDLGWTDSFLQAFSMAIEQRQMVKLRRRMPRMFRD